MTAANTDEEVDELIAVLGDLQERFQLESDASPPDAPERPPRTLPQRIPPSGTYSRRPAPRR